LIYHISLIIRVTTTVFYAKLGFALESEMFSAFIWYPNFYYTTTIDQVTVIFP